MLSKYFKFLWRIISISSKNTLIAIAITCCSIGNTNAALNAGNISFVQYNADNPDNFAFVALVDIADSEQIKFTDNGWKSDNSWRAGEGIVTWTAVGTVSAGTVVTITGTTTSLGTVSGTALLLSAEGDQLIAYQGNTMLAALNNKGAATWQADAADSNSSALPQNLTNGTNAIALSEIDNAKYTGTTIGDVATLLAALNNSANWTGDNSVNQTFSEPFIITSGISSEPDNHPTSFTATAVTHTNSKITTSWVDAIAGTQAPFVYLVLCNTTGTFTVPTDTNAQNDDTDCSDGSGVKNVIHGSGGSYKWTGLNANTQYYFKIYPYTNTGLNIDYKIDGIPVTANATTNSGGFVINEIGADVDTNNGDANGDGIVDITDDEFVEIINNTGSTVNISGWTLSDEIGIKHIFPTTTSIADGCGIVVFGGGTPTGSFGNMVVQTASTNSLGLNNSGDTITLNEGSNDIISESYGTIANYDQSITLDPDLTGSFVKHSTATGSSGSLFSPGTQIDGSNFSACDSSSPEPTNHATDFAATADSNSQITNVWTDTSTGTIPDGYLVMCNKTGTFTAPTDGNAQTDDENCADGSGVKNMTQGTGTYAWASLDADTQYYFKIYAYTNSGTNIDYKIDGTPPTANATTFKDISLVINEIDYDDYGSTISPEEVGFIELKNVSGSEIDFSTTPYALELINGNTSTIYRTIALNSGTIADGDYYVICSHAARVHNCDLDQNTDNLLQKDTEAVALKQGSFIVDTVSYEGNVTNYVETTGTTADVNGKHLLGLSRYPDGQDTNNNSADFQLKCATPGTANNMTANDDCYRIYLSDASITEGHSGTKTLDVTVSLTHASASNITVDYQTEEIGSATAGEDYVAIGLTQLIFPAGDNTPKIISVTINSDEIDEGASEQFKVRLYDHSNNAQITTAGYEIDATITDDDDASFTVNPTSLTISEPNTSKTFSIKLNSEPTDNVIINLPDNFALLECSLDKASLTFTPSNWNVEQTVTVTAKDDSSQDGTQNCDILFSDPFVINTTDPQYSNEFPSDVIVQVEDDESPGGTIIESGGNTQIGEDGLTTDTYEFVLRQPPVDEVTVSLSIDPSTAFQCEIIEPFSAPLIFTTSDWDTPQTVTVKAIPDETAETAIHDCIIVHDFASTDTTYLSLPAKNVTIAIVDDDKAEIIIDAIAPFMVSEPNSTMDFSIKLTSEPANGNDVTIGLSTSNSQCSVPSSVTITSTDWLFGQFVTVTAVDDSIIDGDQTCIVQTASSTSADPNYAGIDPDDLTVTVLDDDIPGVDVSGTPTLAEGGAAGTYSLALNTIPTGDVTIGITPEAQCEVSLNGTNFGTTQTLIRNDKTSQTVMVRAIDDSQIEGNHTCTINHAITASADSNYSTTMSILDATASITDNDPGVVITQSSGSTAVTEGGATDSYTVQLSTAPNNDVTITVTPDVQTDIGSGAGIVKTLTAFNNTNWNNAQTVTVTAVDDTTVENTHSSTISHSSVATADVAYDGGSVVFMVDGTATNQVSVNITDNDSPPPTETPTDSSSGSTPLPQNMTLIIKMSGLGTGQVTSNPSGLNCQTKDEECQATFDTATKVKLTATANAGSEFLYFSGPSDCTDGEIFLTSNTLCNAYFKWLPKTLTVTQPEHATIISTPQGIVCGTAGNTCQYQFDGGKTVTLSVTPDTGWQLDAWARDCNESGQVTLMTDKTCGASFTEIPMVIATPPAVETLTPEVTTPIDASTPDNSTTESKPDSEITPEFNSAETTEADSNEENTKTETTFFSLDLEILGNGKVISIPEGINCESNCSAEFTAKTQLILTAMPMPGFQFSGWGQNCRGLDNPLTIKLDQSRYCTASFQELPPETVDIELPPTLDKHETLMQETPSLSAETEDNAIEKPEMIEELENEFLSPVTFPLSPCYDREGWLDGEKWLDWVCHAQGDTLPGDLIVRKNGYLSYAIVETTIENQGWFSNSVIKKTGIVRGGILTGYISNEGQLENFDFRGRSIIGGTLAGNIINNSEVGGYFQDVHLAAKTEIQGGTLKGHIEGEESGPSLLKNVNIAGDTLLKHVTLGKNVTILLDSIVLENVFLGPDFQLTDGQIQGYLIGDAEAPAQLDNITIKLGSFLDNVIIGPTVKGITDEVTLGEGVILVEAVAENNSSGKASLETEKPACRTRGQALKSKKRLDDVIDSAICFTGRLKDRFGSENKNRAKFTHQEAQTLTVSITMTPMAMQVGETANVLMVGIYQAKYGPSTAYWRDGNTWRIWDGHLDNLTAAEVYDNLPHNLETLIFEGDLSFMPGEFTVYVGIQLKDGTIHYNGIEPMQFEVE